MKITTPKLNIFLEHIYEGAEQEKIPLEKMLLNAKNTGYDGLECDLWRLSEKQETKKLFDSCGLSVSSVYNMYDMGHKEFGVSKEMILNHLETAAYFGAKTVLAVPGFIHPEDNFDTVRGKMAETLCYMCEAAKQYGITVTLED